MRASAAIPYSRILLFLLIFLSSPRELSSQSSSLPDSSRALISKGDYPHAIELLQKELREGRKSPELLRLAGEANARTQQYEKAIDCYRESAELAPCDTCHADFDSLGAM